MLFIGKQQCLHKSFQTTYLQQMSVFMQTLKFIGVTVFALQLFNNIKWKKNTTVDDKELENLCFIVFPRCYVKIHLFSVNLFFLVCFRH